MAKIARILIKGTSGYCSADHAFNDKVTITPSSISYEYKPYLLCDENRPAKWSYRTSSPAYRELFWKVAARVEAILAMEENYFVTDIGSTTFIVTYDDKTRAKREFELPGDEFADCFSLVKQMVPGLESVPEVLKTSEDW